MAWKDGQLLQNGKFLIIRNIGKGGFGLTYLAQNTIFDKQVIIKRPKPDQEFDEKYCNRFQREGKILAKIKHDNVVEMLDIFIEDGIPCLVLEYVEGETLNKYVQRKKYVPQDEAVECFRKLAAALQEIHQKGLVHCDIHPDNVILRPSGEPVLIDFGSVKLLQPHTETVTTTVNQNFVPYEQQKIDSEQQPTWDVHGLAATMYFAVTGKKPIPAMQRKLGDLKLIAPIDHLELSDWVNQAILKGMELEAEDRSQSMEAWMDLLQPPKVVLEEPSQPSEPPPPPRKRKASTFFLWTSPGIALGFLSLTFVPTGILLYMSSTTTIAANGAKIIAAIAIVSMFLAELIDDYEKNGIPNFVILCAILPLGGGIAFLWAILVTLAGMIANMAGMSIAIEKTWGLDLSWELFWSSLWMLFGVGLASSVASFANYDSDDASDKWFDLLVFTGGLLAAMMSAYCTNTGINWRLAWISSTFLLLNISNFCFINISKLSKKRYLRVGHIRLIIICLSALLGLGIGGGAGWWFKLSGFKIT